MVLEKKMIYNFVQSYNLKYEIQMITFSTHQFLSKSAHRFEERYFLLIIYTKTYNTLIFFSDFQALILNLWLRGIWLIPR